MYWKTGKGYFAVHRTFTYIHGTFRIHSKYIHTNQSQFGCELSSCNVKNVLEFGLKVKLFCSLRTEKTKDQHLFLTHFNNFIHIFLKLFSISVGPP